MWSMILRNQAVEMFISYVIVIAHQNDCIKMLENIMLLSVKQEIPLNGCFNKTTAWSSPVSEQGFLSRPQKAQSH